MVSLPVVQNLVSMSSTRIATCNEGEAAGRTGACPQVMKLERVKGEVGCGAKMPPGTLSGLMAPFGVVGLSYKTAPKELRSKVGISKDDLPIMLARAHAAGLTECAILSTCNRTEIYFAGAEPKIVENLLAEHAGVPTEQITEHLYVRSCFCAACHLFRVTAGLDSAVLGESEIVAQVKEAKSLARKSEMMGPMLDLLFRRAMEASKRIRAETELCRNVVSVATLAVREAESPESRNQTFALLGAGKIATRIAKELAPLHRGKTVVVNRSAENAKPLAALLKANVRGLESLEATLVEADVVFAAIGAGQPVIDEELFARVISARGSRPLLLVDLGLPPNSSVDDLPPSVRLVGLEDLTYQSAANEEARNDAVQPSLSILDEELKRFGEALVEQAASPTIRALMQLGENVSKRNLEWALEKLPELDAKHVRVLEELMRRTVIGMLESPINTLKTDIAWAERRHLIENLFAVGGGD